MTEAALSHDPSALLVINSGSSSVKFAIFSAAEYPVRVASGAVERIGLPGARLRILDSDGATIVEKPEEIPDHRTAVSVILDAIEERAFEVSLVAAGHRVVHGGPDCDCPAVVTEPLEARLRRLEPLAPLHQPHNLDGIAAVRAARPGLLQVACFDTAFHHGLPRLATLTALPREFFDEGIRRYGFHGLSFEYVVDSLRAAGVNVERERIVVAHLGNGASMCAVGGGRSIETTMGFSPLAGLPMGTRCGDLDPGVLLYLLGERNMSVERVRRLLYEESGLLGVSGLSRNMRDLLAQPAKSAATEAVELFSYQARRHLAALTASLGGLDRLVFTGGIGANAPQIREKICSGLGYLGVVLDLERNAAGVRRISADGDGVMIDAFPTDEEFIIARHVHRLLPERAGVKEG